jgi:hypothetical protein
MTTRSETKGSVSSPYFLDRDSSGSNGKYETVGGSKRDKWNNYSFLLREQRCKGSSTVPVRYQNLQVQPVWSSHFSSSDQLNLFSKLSSKARGHDFNLAVNVAQGKQTIGMCADVLKSFGLAALDAKRGNFTSAIRRFNVSPGSKSRFKYKDISSRWLELQYGWLPAMGDSYEALLAFQKSTEKRDIRFSVGITRYKKWEASASPSLYGSNGQGLVMGKRRIICELTETISNNRALGLTDPLSVVWEVIPWSFVIDWFLPVGSYLENLNVIPKLSGRFLTTSFYTACEHGVSLNPTGGWQGSTGDVRMVRVDRTVSTSLTVPPPSFISLPDAMSPKRIYNAMALSHQRFRVAGLE